MDSDLPGFVLRPPVVRERQATVAPVAASQRKRQAGTARWAHKGGQSATAQAYGETVEGLAARMARLLGEPKRG